MDAYLISNGQDFSILYNKSKIPEEKEIIATESRMQHFIRNMPFYNLFNRVNEWTKRILQSSTGKVLTAAAGSGLLVHYAGTMTEEGAKEAFDRIVRREIKRCNLVALVNLILIPAAYIPPLTFVYGTTALFGVAIYQSIKIKKTIKKHAGKAVFRKDSALSELEKKILGTQGIKNAETWFEEYDFT